MKPSLRRVVAAATTLALGVVGLAAAALTTAPAAQAASLVSVPSFGSNPGQLGMSLFVPDSLPAKPAVLVVVHWCTGSAQAIYDGGQFDELATRYGYIVIYPQANRSGSCFDVSSSEALVHGGASDPTSIVSMVRHVQQQYTTDTSRVFVTGVSSGAMMTEVLLATYPDVFAAGSAFAGVPATCFSTTSPPPGTGTQAPWNSDCSGGRLVRTGQQWGDLARAAYPGYTGARPRVQLWHGSQDTTLSYVNHGEAIKQWTNVLGVSETPASTDSPAANQTRTRYGATGDRPPVEAITFQGVGHNLPVDAAAAIHFFGLDSTTTPSPTTPAPTTPAPTTPAPTTPAPTTTGTHDAGTEHPAAHDSGPRGGLHRRVLREPVEHRLHGEHHRHVQGRAERLDADVDVPVGSDSDAGVELGHHPDRVAGLGEERGVEQLDPGRPARSSSASTARTRAPTRHRRTSCSTGCPARAVDTTLSAARPSGGASRCPGWSRR